MARYGVAVLLIVMMGAIAVLAGVCGTQRVGEMQRQSKSIQAQNAQSAPNSRWEQES
jgi:uncharacterized integral membrane protein